MRQVVSCIDWLREGVRFRIFDAVALLSSFWYHSLADVF